MEDKYIYLIIVAIIFGVIALYAIKRFRSVEGEIELPDGTKMRGKGTEESSGGDAITEVEGDVEDAKMKAKSNAGSAIQKIKGSVKGAEINTEVDKR